jgi:hypothetical protein
VEDEKEQVRVLVSGKGWVPGELHYERDGYCRVTVDGKSRTVLASRVKRTSKLAASALITMANKAAEVGAGAEAYLAIAKGDLSAAIPFVDAMREADGATDDPVAHARLHAEVFPESPALRPVFADSPTLRAVPKPPKPMRDAAYLAFVRERDCCARDGVFTSCDGPIEAHHFGPRGMGQKADDWYAVPLCQYCHRHFHDHGQLPHLNRADTEDLFAAAQRELLLEWLGCAKDKEIVDAIVSVLRKERER